MTSRPMSNIDKHGLLGVPKHANQHRLSRLTMEVHTDELRIMASAVESYTDELVAALEAAEKRIAELEAREEALRPVGVMSEKAFHRLERSDARFIALWPRPGIYLPRKRPEDGVIVYARTAGITVKGDSE